MASEEITVPPMKDLNIDNITENTITINSQSSDQRLTYLMERLVTHLHDFARETRLSTNEWMAALNFLVRVGQISSDVRHVSSLFLADEVPGVDLSYRNSSSSPTSSASRSSSTPLTTPSLLPARRARCWGRSTPTKRKAWPTAP